MEKSAQKARNSAAAGRMKNLRAKQFTTQGFAYRDFEKPGGVSLSAAHRVRRDNAMAMSAVPRLISRPQGIGGPVG